MTHYTNHSISVQDNADSAAVIIGSLVNCSAPIDQEVQANATAGRFYPEQITIASQKPRMTFSTYDLPKVLTAFGLVGRRITDGASKPGIALYQAQYADSALVSGSNHRRLRFSESYAMIRRISVSHRQDAMAEVEAIALWDGTNNPVIPEATQALPTLPASSGRWTLGDVEVGGISIGCNIQVDFDFGVNVEAFGCDSDIWDTHLNINQIVSRITITSLQPQGFATSGAVPLTGLIGTHANTTFYLRKRLAQGAGFVADATEEHIAITASGVLLVSDAHNAQANQRAQMSLQMECDYDGTNAPFTFDTTAAL
jgi:hypothetical protein